jgi:hypothetical protein
VESNAISNAKKADQRPRGTPVGRQTLAEVDAGLAECEAVIKLCSDAVKIKLGINGSIPPNLLRDLARSNAQRQKLVLRRVTLLLESGDTISQDLIEKLMKIKPKAI